MIMQIIILPAVRSLSVKSFGTGRASSETRRRAKMALSFWNMTSSSNPSKLRRATFCQTPSPTSSSLSPSLLVWASPTTMLTSSSTTTRQTLRLSCSLVPLHSLPHPVFNPREIPKIPARGKPVLALPLSLQLLSLAFSQA